MLKSGQRLRGVLNGIASPAIVEMCAYAGFDFIIIDNEHGSASLETTEHMLRAARATNLPALVRCLAQDIARTLDIGAGGLQIPMVNTAEQACRLVQKRGNWDEDKYARWGARNFASVTTGIFTKALRDAAQGGTDVLAYQSASSSNDKNRLKEAT